MAESMESQAVPPRSRFAQKLAADPVLAKRCEEIVRALRAAALPDIEAGERAERLTGDDFRIVINARAEGQ